MRAIRMAAVVIVVAGLVVGCAQITHEVRDPVSGVIVRSEYKSNFWPLRSDQATIPFALPTGWAVAEAKSRSDTSARADETVAAFGELIGAVGAIYGDLGALPLPLPAVTTSTTTSTSTTAAGADVPVTSTTSTTGEEPPAPPGVARYEQTTRGWRHDPNNAAETIVLRSARLAGGEIKLDYDCPKGLSGRRMDGGSWISYAGLQAWAPAGEGQWRGGWFDHCVTDKKGCQTRKNLHNLANGYWGAGSALPDGAMVNIMSSDGRQRSNLVRVDS